uniref:Uncharacterized protein n=1 Tax=Anguilla anguilla TaxID=7936 RepID=A0A0E9W6L7_ANGAN
MHEGDSDAGFALSEEGYCRSPVMLAVRSGKEYIYLAIEAPCRTVTSKQLIYRLTYCIRVAALRYN